MNAETFHGISDEEATELAEQAASFDEALAAGREPPPVSPEVLDVPSALLAAWASLRLLERVWPRSCGAGGPDPSALVPDFIENAPTTFGRFQIVRELGHGGFGIVFLAMDPKLGRSVALKVPQPGTLLDPHARERFAREACAIAGLDHPNIVPLYEAGEVGTVCYLAEAYCEGPTLAAWLRAQAGPVPPRLAAKVVAALANAIQHAHGRGILHRDLKPSNVLIQRSLSDRSGAAAPPVPATDGEPDFVVRIIDFGLARLMDLSADETTASLAAIGSAPYMAPEQVEGKKVGPATDVYGLGAVLYAMLCGRAPHRGANSAETLRRVVNDEPAPPRRTRSDVSRDLEAICLKCLEKAPGRRYRSARELAEDLERFLNGRATLARPVSMLNRAWRAARRRPARFATLALLSALAIAGLLGVRWYEARLDAHRHAADELGHKIGSRDARLQREFDARRRIQYVADVRQAARFVNNRQADLATKLLDRNRPRPGLADLREFAWRLLRRRCHTESRTLRGHRGDVYHVEFSPNGSLLASAGMDGVVRLWDLSTWQPAGSIAASETEINAITFAPDGRALATVDDAGKLKLWETGTDRCLWAVTAHGGEALNARFLSDGRRIVTAGRADRFVKIWGRSNGALLDAIPAREFILAPGGAAIAILGDDGRLDLYNPSTREHHKSLRVGDRIEDAAFSHDGRWLANPRGSDFNILLWDLSNHRVRHELRGHDDGGHSVAFSPDDRTLISTASDGTVRIWDVETGHERLAHLGHMARTWSVAVSPDGRTIASASRDETVKLWSTHTFEIPARFSASADLRDLAFSPDGRALLGIGADGLVSTWDDGTSRPRTSWRIAAPGSITDAVIGRDGRTAAVRKPDQSVELHDLAARRLLGTIRGGPVDGPVTMAFDTDVRRLAVAGRARGASLWSVPELRRLATIEGDVTHVLFAPDGRTLYTTEPGGKLVSRGPADGRTRPVPALGGIPTFAFLSVARAGNVYAATANHNIHLCSSIPAGGPKAAALVGHVLDVQGLAFSPNGKTLASGDRGGAVKLWDVAACEELLALEACPGPVGAIRFSPDGDALAACGVRPDGTAEVLVWRAANRGGPAFHP